MFKHDPIITYNHMQDEVKKRHPMLSMPQKKWSKILFVAEVFLMLVVVCSLILLMM